MEIKVQDRKEGGWMVTGAKDGYHSFRYIIPSSDRFLVINSFKLETLEKKATQGEWTTQRFPNGCHFDRILRDGYTVDGVTYVPDYEHPMLCKDDAALIAAARNALPELIRLARIGQRVERVERDAKEEGK